jgi:NNP family nitrate/nitrite transporter-like MFS transporter
VQQRATAFGQSSSSQLARVALPAKAWRVLEVSTLAFTVCFMVSVAVKQVVA